MGLLRVYLALCVVSGHSGSVLPWAIHGGREAVQIFFMISGFYMAMVLSQGYPSVKEFYISRWLRIFIPYYIVLILVILWSAVVGKIFGTWLQLTPYISHPLASNGLTGIIFTALSNVTIFFQDWVMFLQHEQGKSFGFTSNFWDNKSPLWHYLLIPQCWSVGVELTFYLLVPYINKLRTRVILFVLAFSLIVRLIAYHLMDLQHDPWTYRFFPFELALFLSGMIGWRIYAKYNLANKFPVCKKKSSYLVACSFVLLALFLHTKITERLSMVLGIDDAVLLSYLFCPVIIAVLFAYFRRSSIDRFIGELSYPIYLLHVMVIGSISPLLQKLHVSGSYLGILGALITILISLVIFLFVLQPFERWRHAFLIKMAKK